MVNKEIEKKINTYTEELDKKYQSVIKEKTHGEEVAWKQYEKVLSQKRDTEAVIRSIAEGLVVVDARGRVIMMNSAAESEEGCGAKFIFTLPLSRNP